MFYERHRILGSRQIENHSPTRSNPPAPASVASGGQDWTFESNWQRPSSPRNHIRKKSYFRVGKTCRLHKISANIETNWRE